jgi:hypothetical protein
VCAAEARVHILLGYDRDRPVTRRLCESCAAAASSEQSARQAGRGRRLLALLSLTAGSAMIVVGVFADVLLRDGAAGFGWRQITGTGLGACIAFMGLLFRSKPILLAGACLMGASMLADAFGLGHSPGFGWKQATFVAAGVGLLVCTGVSFAMLRVRNARRRFVDQPERRRHSSAQPIGVRV